MQVGLLESHACLVSGTICFSDLELICPSKSWFSQDYFLCGKNVAERALFGCFFSLLVINTLSKISQYFWFDLFFHVDSKYVNHFARGCPHQKRNDATHLLEKTCFSNFKIHKWPKMLKISWNLAWVICIKYYVGPMKLQPRSWAYLSLSCSSKFSSTWTLGSLSLLWKSYFMPNSDKPCAATSFSPCWLSQAASPSAYFPSLAKILDQHQSLAQVVSIWLSSSLLLACFPLWFAAPWLFVCPPIACYIAQGN